MTPRTSFPLILWLPFLAFGTSACSLDMFSDREDRPASPMQTRYRKIRPECSGLKLASRELDVPTFRKLIECFNSNGSMPEIARLVADASDETLAQSTSLLNQTFLTDAIVLSESRAVIRSLRSSDLWAPSVADFAVVFQDPERVRALVRLLSVGNAAPVVRETFRNFQADETVKAFGILHRISVAPAYGALREKLESDPLRPSERADLVRSLTRLMNTETKFGSAREVLSDMARGRATSLWDYAFGSPSEVAGSTARLGGLLREFGREDGKNLRELSRFHRGFHQPVTCWDGAKIFNSPWENLADEITRHSGSRLLPFIARFAPLATIGVRDVCKVPDEVPEFLPRILSMLGGPHGAAYLGVLDRVFSGGLGVSAGNFVGEWGEAAAEALAILSEKAWFDDLLLLFAELDEADREHIAGWVRAMLTDQA